MAKKMQRLDESPDYRPFKFRIQAFTNAFLEEVCVFFFPLVCFCETLIPCQLSRQGYPEEKIPMKKVGRHFRLWSDEVKRQIKNRRSVTFRFETFCGTNPTSHDSTKREKSQNPREITFGTWMQRNQRADGCSDRFNGDWRERPPVSLMLDFAGRGHPGSGIPRHPEPICL